MRDAHEYSPRMGQVQDVEMFVAVVDAGSLSGAARRLGRSQPTVTRQLAALETRLGARLLERTTRQMRLTAAGRVYYERSAALIALAREAEAAVVETSQEVRGAIRFSAPPTYARKRIAPLLGEFLASYPDVRLEMVLTGDLADVVREPLDLVVRLGALPDSTLACRPLPSERFVLCASPGYLERFGAPRAVTDLATRRCLVTESFGLRNRWTFPGGRRRRVVEVRASLVSDDLSLLHEAACLGLGIAALPGYLVAGDFATGALVGVLERERLPAFPVHAVLPSARHVPRRARAFVDFLAARLRATTAASSVRRK